jgi:hypothetical protein
MISDVITETLLCFNACADQPGRGDGLARVEPGGAWSGGSTISPRRSGQPERHDQVPDRAIILEVYGRQDGVTSLVS